MEWVDTSIFWNKFCPKLHSTYSSKSFILREIFSLYYKHHSICINTYHIFNYSQQAFYYKSQISYSRFLCSHILNYSHQDFYYKSQISYCCGIQTMSLHSCFSYSLSNEDSPHSQAIQELSIFDYRDNVLEKSRSHSFSTRHTYLFPKQGGQIKGDLLNSCMHTQPHSLH